jgi:transposase InsO family protein
VCSLCSLCIATLFRSELFPDLFPSRLDRPSIPGEVLASTGSFSTLVDRDFATPAPNQLWVADFTYVATWTGTVSVACEPAEVGAP